MPVKRPVDGLMVAMEGLLLVHVPPGVGSVNSNVLPTQTAQPEVDGHEMGPGVGLTVTLYVEKHPVPGIVKVMVHTPAATPVTTPEEEPTETLVHELLQTPTEPGGGVQLSVVVWPTQITLVPVIGPGFGLTATVIETEQPPGRV
jgi:hypothetical protein